MSMESGRCGGRGAVRCPGALEHTVPPRTPVAWQNGQMAAGDGRAETPNSLPGKCQQTSERSRAVSRSWVRNSFWMKFCGRNIGENAEKEEQVLSWIRKEVRAWERLQGGTALWWGRGHTRAVGTGHLCPSLQGQRGCSTAPCSGKSMGGSCSPVRILHRDSLCKHKGFHEERNFPPADISAYIYTKLVIHTIHLFIYVAALVSTVLCSVFPSSAPRDPKHSDRTSFPLVSVT